MLATVVVAADGPNKDTLVASSNAARNLRRRHTPSSYVRTYFCASESYARLKGERASTSTRVPFCSRRFPRRKSTCAYIYYAVAGIRGQRKILELVSAQLLAATCVKQLKRILRARKRAAGSHSSLQLLPSLGSRSGCGSGEFWFLLLNCPTYSCLRENLHRSC